MPKLKITKYVWFENEKWKVEQIIQPTKFDCYLLISQNQTMMTHADQKTTPIYITIVDIHNDVFYPDTKQVRELIERQKWYTHRVQSMNKKLQNIWLDTVKDD
jgi:hypothetical protein